MTAETFFQLFNQYGLLRMPVKWFIGWSAAGITVWNTALISFGYFFSEKILSMVM